jgi:vitamin B12/bleomycin/antimicrobial peptide transport system ATP-binding/permease protein
MFLQLSDLTFTSPLPSASAVLAMRASPKVPPPTAGKAFEARLLCDLGLANLVSALHDDWVADWCKNLSLGEQQRLSVARAVLHRPQWLFLDEPFSAMDDAQQRCAAKVLSSELASTTILCVTHMPHQSALNISRQFTFHTEPVAPTMVHVTRIDSAA